MARETRGRTSTDDEKAETAKPKPTEKPIGREAPLSEGKGGRYTVVNGRRVKRTD